MIATYSQKLWLRWVAETENRKQKPDKFLLLLSASQAAAAKFTSGHQNTSSDWLQVRLLSTLQMMAHTHGYKNTLHTVGILNEKSDIKKKAKAWSPSIGGLSEKNYCCSTSLPAEPTATNTHLATANCSDLRRHNFHRSIKCFTLNSLLAGFERAVKELVSLPHYWFDSFNWKAEIHSSGQHSSHKKQS